jgi:hypothetical protein
MQRADGSRFVVVAQQTSSDVGCYLESYEVDQAVRLPTIPAAIVDAVTVA